jgi:CPA2 family monovalent cation:H+ antiporter-2
MRLMGQTRRASLLVAFGTAQIGEFSFVLAGLGRQLGVMSETTYNLIIGAAMLSIAANPFLMRLVPDQPPPPRPEPKAEPAPAPAVSA